MKFPSISPNLIQTATAITLGILAFPHTASATSSVVVIEEKIDTDVNRPQLLVKDNQQIAILQEANANQDKSSIKPQYSFSGNQRLNKLSNLARQSPSTLVAFESPTSESQPVVIDSYPNSDSSVKSSNESIYIPIQSSNVDDSASVSVPLEIQDKSETFNDDSTVIGNVETEPTSDNTSIPVSIFYPDSQNATNLADSDPHNDTETLDKPVLISPSNQLSAESSENVAVISSQPTTSGNIDNSSSWQEENYQEETQVASSISINIEYYNPTVLPSAGEMVSPDLPYLYPPDQYLPENDRPFNGYIWPAKGVLTSGYGWRWGRMHKGIDIAAPIGTPIVAVADGEVVSAGWNSGGYGNLVKLRHYDGSVTLYAHNSKLLVRRGQRVKQGQLIAKMGSTGFSTGPHLHFEIHPQGDKAVNPIAYLPKK